MQIPVLSGIYTDQIGGFRTSYPRNYVPVPKDTGISKGHLRPADGIELRAVGPGVDRGAWVWNGVEYRVMGTKLVSISASSVVTVLGDVGAGGQVTMDNSFDYLAVWAGGRLYYWNGSLQQVADPDLGNVIDGKWIGGYFLSTDGESLIATDINDPFSVNPLRYGSSELDPDPVQAVDELRNEAIALNRYTMEWFRNVGGDGFPFQRIDGAQVLRGVIGTHAYAQFAETIAFLGSGKNEPPSVYIAASGATQKLATSEIDRILQGYTEAQLAASVVEARVDKGHNWLMIHLPDTCWVYDAAASQIVGEPVWFELNSAVVGKATYRARNAVWCYDGWQVGDPTSSNIGRMTEVISSHYGEAVGWDFGTMVIYNEGRGAIIHQMELVGLPGRVSFGASPTVWTSYSLDGETWGQERAVAVGKQGQRDKRIVWLGQGSFTNYRMQRFRGTSDSHMSVSRIEAEMEPLYG